MKNNVPDFQYFCRFQKEVITYNDIPGWRFTVPDDVFASPNVNKENICYCSSSVDCAPSGTFNVSACQFGKNYDISIFPSISNKNNIGKKQKDF